MSGATASLTRPRKSRRASRSGRPQQRIHRPNPDAAVVAAGLAPATHLGIPRLQGLRGSYRAERSRQETAALCLAMLEAGVADHKDWTGDLLEFLDRTVERWVSAANGAWISRTFGFTVSLNRYPAGFAEFFNEPPDRFYLELRPEIGDHFSLEMGPMITKLEEADRRFPSMFWHRLTGSLRRTGLEVWDPLWAIEGEKYGWFGDWFDELEADSMYDAPGRPTRITPKSLQRAHLQDRTVLRALSSGSYDSWVGRLMWGALELAELAKGADTGWKDLTADEKEAFNDAMGQAPSLVAWIIQGDGIAHLIDMQGDAIWQSGEELSPACCWAFEPTPEGVAAAHGKFMHTARILATAAQLVQQVHRPIEETVPLRIALQV